jgi:WD40 repeat protein
VPRLQLTRQLTGHPEVVAAVAFSPDGKRLLSGGFDETGFRKLSHVRLWDIASGQAVWTGEAPSGVPAVGFSPDGKTFASVPMQGSPSVWTIAD